MLVMYSSGSVWGQVIGYSEVGIEISESIQSMHLISQCTVIDYLKLNTPVAAHKKEGWLSPAQKKKLLRSTENLSVSNLCLVRSRGINWRSTQSAVDLVSSAIRHLRPK